MAINPMWWLHTRVSGSPRSNLLMVFGYLCIVVVFASISSRMVGTPPGGRPDYGPYYAAWLGIVTAAQSVFCLLLIPGAIKKAVQRDYQSGMAESHRLTPMSSLAIIRGYLVGPAIQPLMLFGAGLLVGTFFAAKSAATMGITLKLSAQVVVGGWLGVNGMLLVLTLLIASISLLSAIAVREGKFNILGLLIAGGFMGGPAGITFVPGLALVTGAMSGSLVLALFSRTPALGDQSAVVSTALLQIALALTFLYAAARKFRSPDRPIFPLGLSLLLAGLWGAALVLGMVHGAVTGFAHAGYVDLQSIRLACSVFAFMLVGLFALHAAAADRLRLDRQALFGDRSHSAAALFRSMMPVLLTVLAMLLLVAMIVVLRVRAMYAPLAGLLDDWRVWATVVASVLLSCWFDYFAFYWAASRRAKMWVVLLVIWGLLKIVPILLDGALTEFNREMYERSWDAYGYISSVSPLGAVIMAREPGAYLVVGLAVQFALVLLAGGLALRAKHRLADRLKTYSGLPAPTAAEVFKTTETPEPDAGG